MLFLLCLVCAIFSREVVSSSQSQPNYKPLVEFSFEMFKQHSAITVVSTNDRFNAEMFELNSVYLSTTISLFEDVRELQPPKDVSHGFIIVSDNWEDILEMKKRSRNGALVMVVTEHKISTVTAFFMYAWSLRFKDIIMAQPGNNGGIYAFNPFLNHTKKFGIRQVEEINKFLTPKNYHGVTIQGTLFDTSPITVNVNGVFLGIDPMIIKTINQCLNVTIDTHVPYDGEHFGYKSKNGTATGAIKELYTKESEIAFNQIFVKDYHTPELTFTNTISDDCVCVIVPKASLIPKWTAIFYAFSNQVWIAIFIIITTAIIGLFIIRKYDINRTAKNIQNEHVYDHSWSTVCLDVCQALFNITYRNVFSSKYHNRLILGALFLHALIINTLFQGSLVTVTTSQKRYPDINTMKQLVESNYYISTYSPTLADIFNNTENPYMQKLSKRFILLDDESPPLPAILSRRLKHNFLFSTKQKGTQDIHIVQECARSFSLAYLVHRNAYFLHDFNDIIAKVVEAGLINQWNEMLKLNLSDMLEQNTYVEEHVEFPRPFTVIDLQTSFYILIVGLTISYIVFLFEYYSGRCYYVP
ncbi:hypothetical protein RI129_005761 [Pyrocoelia pectoralis]|uniref:Ionotropic glutamate receptor C-terminal domain-containing protein n=1 Tax=Pyrocoelia pectoralis TaxID=417401 RepID=A0AAN7VG22_9COLE